MTAPLRATVLLGLVAALTALLAQGVAELTATRIEANRTRARDAAVERAVPGLAGSDWRATARRQLLAGGAVLTTVPVADRGPVRVLSPWPAPGGYAGPIELLVAVDAAGRVLRVDVLRHRETPGLGDRMERRHGNWLEVFTGRRLAAPGAPGAPRWAAAADGGDFDTITGATVTTRAVVGGVERALRRLHETRQAVPR